jgi:hypothetical protein
MSARLSIFLGATLAFSGQAIAQDSNANLFGIILLDAIQNYSADLYSAEVDPYAGPPFMTVDVVPPLRDSVAQIG